MVVVVAVLVAFFGMIYSRISLDRTAFELQELEHQITQQQEQMEGLRVEAARLQDPEVITARAAGLGLVYPESRTPLLVDDVETQRVVERVVRADLRAMRSAQP
jgi:cell division protein FtsL